jgi:hypothetical protein
MTYTKKPTLVESRFFLKHLKIKKLREGYIAF